MKNKKPPSVETRQIHARQRARRVAMQAIYQWQMTQYHPQDILDEYTGDPELQGADIDYFRNLVLGVAADSRALDQALERHTDKRMAEVDPVERAIARLGAYELLYQPSLPTPVILSEAVALGRKFGATDGYRFINALLDKLACEVRSTSCTKAPS